MEWDALLEFTHIYFLLLLSTGEYHTLSHNLRGGQCCEQKEVKSLMG